MDLNYEIHSPSHCWRYDLINFVHGTVKVLYAVILPNKTIYFTHRRDHNFVRLSGVTALFVEKKKKVVKMFS